MIVTEQALRTFTEAVFLKIGCPETDAALAADVLLKADLRGIESHGVARLTGYVRLWEKGRINPLPQLRVAHETATTATLNADRALGLVSAPHAMKLAISKAGQYGSGWVAVKNSNHFGIAAYHAMMAAEKDMIGIAMTNASPLVSPTFTTERLLGTNPICYVFPAGRYKPLVVDMATSAAANGKLEIAQRAGKPVPRGWVQTASGAGTTNASALKSGGALLPLGSDREHGSHKGFGLGAIVDILSGILPGANYGPWVPPFVAFLDPLPDLPGEGIGHFLGAIRVDGFRPADEFKSHIDNWIDRFSSATPANPDQPVIIPGQPETLAEATCKKNGIPLVDAVVNDLKEISVKLNIGWPW
jgi:LDH2 family malate/lactate/ureidoglycolate dehydrogenase